MLFYCSIWGIRSLVYTYVALCVQDNSVKTSIDDELSSSKMKVVIFKFILQIWYCLNKRILVNFSYDTFSVIISFIKQISLVDFIVKIMFLLLIAGQIGMIAIIISIWWDMFSWVWDQSALSFSADGIRALMTSEVTLLREYAYKYITSILDPPC